ncbi:MAG: DUF551 domain-containing protein [Oscillospiraceae bacterium]
MDVMEKLVDIVCDATQINGCIRSCNHPPCAMVRGIVDALIENGVTVQEWIPVTERLPDNKEDDWVLAQVVEDNGFMHIPNVMEYRQQRNDWLDETYGWLSEHNGAFTVTHWMPLPEPPKGVLDDAEAD